VAKHPGMGSWRRRARRLAVNARTLRALIFAVSAYFHRAYEISGHFGVNFSDRATSLNLIDKAALAN